MTKRDSDLSIGTIIGAFVAMVVGFWLIVRVLRAVFWLLKVGLVLGLIVAVVIAINRATSKRK